MRKRRRGQDARKYERGGDWASSERGPMSVRQRRIQIRRVRSMAESEATRAHKLHQEAEDEDEEEGEAPRANWPT